MLLLSIYVHAQAYIPKDGEKFFFYPVSNNIANTVNGYDCFYFAKIQKKTETGRIFTILFSVGASSACYVWING